MTDEKFTLSAVRPQSIGIRRDPMAYTLWSVMQTSLKRYLPVICRAQSEPVRSKMIRGLSSLLNASITNFHWGADEDTVLANVDLYIAGASFFAFCR